jgi:hypothetical protein
MSGCTGALSTVRLLTLTRYTFVFLVIDIIFQKKKGITRGVYNFYLFCNRCNRVAEVHPHFHTFEFFHIHRLCLGASSKMLPKN